jgi:hypothetical protein
MKHFYFYYINQFLLKKMKKKSQSFYQTEPPPKKKKELPAFSDSLIATAEPLMMKPAAIDHHCCQCVSGHKPYFPANNAVGETKHLLQQGQN